MDCVSAAKLVVVVLLRGNDFHEVTGVPTELARVKDLLLERPKWKPLLEDPFELLFELLFAPLFELLPCERAPERAP